MSKKDKKIKSLKKELKELKAEIRKLKLASASRRQKKMTGALRRESKPQATPPALVKAETADIEAKSASARFGVR
jgi:hypothetical protein